MPFKLTMPKLSPTMTEGVITKWHKKVGDFIEAGDLIVEISTDKAIVEHHAIDPGWLRKIELQEGEKGSINEVLALLSDEEHESIEKISQELKISTSSQQLSSIEHKKSDTVETQQAIPSHKSSRTIASPLAKKIAQQKGISLEKIVGSGPSGRIMSRDLMSIEQDEIETKTAEGKKTTLHQQKPLSPMRQVIAKRLQESKSTIPHFYVSIEVRADKLLQIREEMKKASLSITINDFIVKATALALMQHEVLRTNFDEKTQSIIYLPHADISVAVSINGGLITPIVTSAEEKSIATISQEIKNLVDKAKNNKLLPEEFIGGAFTLSNLGMFGIESFQAIINPPQTAILAIGGVQERAVIENGIVVPGKIMKITLSCDHRVVDGADGAKFLQTLRNLLENPIIILGR